ncbi:MAG: 2Fe-2S iron-sulfur cluster binding domain-containing protein, partial [Chlorobiales bacterium]|nr:2Fe-2S iron-sulfur cluster binding domain-containing protein [Chlorobiales bacterium]
MAKIYIDGIECEALPKQTIIQIADGINNGGKEIVDIPRFCYHPSLSIAGNCRMCMVEMGMPKKGKDGQVELDEKGSPVIAWVPKLTTACTTEIADGMHVRTHHTSQVVADAQKGVLEFILINHPLDCPICDQAGECPLQETTYKYGPEGSRFEFEKVQKPKREKWGKKITFDAERCINCTRCVRFFDEFTKTHELEIVQRGWNNYPALAPGETPDENPYAMNIIDLCPVGALTSTDHRFKARVWEMSATEIVSVAD